MRTLLLTAALLSAAACQTAPRQAVEPAPDPMAQPAPPPATGGTLPAGTDLRMRINADLVPSSVRRGHTFEAVLVEPLVATNGEVALPDGTVATAMVTGAYDEEGTAVLRINFLRMNLKGVSHPFSVEIRESTAGAVAEGENRDAIQEKLGAGPGTILVMTPGTTLKGGTEVTVRTREELDLRRE